MHQTYVLYAEDDENDAFFMERAFSKLGKKGALRMVSNGQRAVEYMSGAGSFADRGIFPLPSLLLLDIKMPEMTGLETLAWVRQAREFDCVPVVILTSSTQPADLAFCAQNGANGYFVKPSDAEQLSGLIQRILDVIAPGVGRGGRIGLPENKLPESVRTQ